MPDDQAPATARRPVILRERVIFAPHSRLSVTEPDEVCLGSVTPPLHDQASWDMHSHGAEIITPQHDRLPAGATVTGVVVCHHAFGLGMFLTDRDEYGHVNITEIRPGAVRGPEDFPAIGSSVEGTVLGYTGIHDQLRISLRQHF